MALVAVKTLARMPAGSEVLIEPEVHYILLTSLAPYRADNPSRIFEHSTNSQAIPAPE